MAEIQEFDLAGLKPFYADAPDESKLANVSLRLSEGRAASFRQHKRSFTEMTKPQKAAAQLGHLPERGESRHVILKGDCALMDFLVAAVQLAGHPVDELHVATLSMSKKNAQDLGVMVQAGKVKSLAIIVSHYFSAAEKEIYGQITEVCRAVGGKVCAMRTHAKVLLLAIGTDRFVIESSANLRSCHNVEQATMFNDVDLFEFHRSWMQDLLVRGERDHEARTSP